jgi:hypothetical protein
MSHTSGRAGMDSRRRGRRQLAAVLLLLRWRAPQVRRIDFYIDYFGERRPAPVRGAAWSRLFWPRVT